ncbi:hypothetical protein LOK74_03695 [Brevibacillus humidisoli]|uniref:hypothetical protein n=1 Tax=Brevibacillus humidisoli TaxID=2895522 RepID=UPI001E633892|nr:hypothetical protein [Brevibacillus humidisoli]UFJ41628.1 hypothetical protein LOK74_03695 [Brevibacillus humidisoli]
MELCKLEPVDVWRLLIPERMQLFEDDMPGDELIFRYRDSVYFVHDDGAVIALPAPAHLEQLSLGGFLEHVMTAEETVDFDEQGMFDIGTILRRIGFVVSCTGRRDQGDYQVEIVDALVVGQTIASYYLTGVTFTFALYHGLLCCSHLNELAEENGEFEVKRIIRCHFPHSDSEKQQKMVYDDTCT